MKINPILLSDSYKYSHFLQYPPGTEYIYSYIEARYSENPDINKTVFFGLQYFLQEYLTRPITMEMVNQAREVVEAHGLPFNYEGFERIVTRHNGYFPVVIEAVPEGTPVDIGNVLVQVYNTDPQLPWVTSFIETALLRSVWYPTTVATNSWAIKKDLIEYAKKSGSDLSGIPFKLHDFGARGVSSHESAMIGGMAHLVNFMGTDTMEAIVAAREYYHEPMAGFSIPAAEHSTITVWGQDQEIVAYHNMLKQFAHKDSLVAVVSDSYDIWNAVDNLWGDKLKEQVLASGATIIVRPDSGDPTMVPISCILRLMNKYGFDTNADGYDTLPSSIRVIQGDGITKDSIEEILTMLDGEKLTLDNIAFGMGGGLLQQVNRDNFGFAMKANHAFVDGVGRNVSKAPTGSPNKNSKSGILKLGYMEDSYKTYSTVTPFPNYLRSVYVDGEIRKEYTLHEIRQRARIT